jgi:hypothetical protein
MWFTVKANVAFEHPSILEWGTVFTRFMDRVYAVLVVPTDMIPMRIVFDVNVPIPGILSGYPIIIGETWTHVLFNLIEPSVQLLQFIAVIGLQLIPNEMFSPWMQGALALVAAYHAVIKRWPQALFIVLPHLSENPLWIRMRALLEKLGVDLIIAGMTKARGHLRDVKENIEHFVTGLVQRKQGTIPGLLEELLATTELSASAADVIFGSA